MAKTVYWFRKKEVFATSSRILQTIPSRKQSLRVAALWNKQVRSENLSCQLFPYFIRARLC